MNLVPSIGPSLVLWVVVNVSHVLAHLCVARRSGIRVDRLSFGIGPTLWSREISGVPFRVALLPVGFLVRLRAPWKRGRGWPPTEETDFRQKSLGARAAVVAAAPMALLILSLLAAFWTTGFDETVASKEAVVGAVAERGPAARAGLTAGDAVLSVDGHAVEGWDDLRTTIARSENDRLAIEIQRNNQRLVVALEPDLSPDGRRRVIGIRPRMEARPAPGLVERAGQAIRLIANYYISTFQGIAVLLSGRIGSEMDFPLAMYDFAAMSGEKLAAMSLTLTILNYLLLCFILPYLDGRRILFLGIETMVRHPLHPRYEQWFNRGLLAAYMGLVVLAFAGDVLRTFA